MSTSDAKPLVIAALGTSLTARGAWLEALPAALEPKIRRPVSAMNFAKVGATSRWGRQIVGQVARVAPDVGIIEFASNDAALHRRVSMSESADNVTQIVRTLRTVNSNVRLYLMTMSPAMGFRGLVRPMLNRYSQLYSGIAQREGAGLIDNRPSWQALPRPELNRALPDGIHPTAEFSLSITLINVVRVLTRDMGL